MKKLYIVFMLLSLFMTSCIEEYNAELPTSESNLLVVEGTIISDTVSTFYLSLTTPVNSSLGKKDVNDATIQLKGDDGTQIDAAFVADGKYEVNTPKLGENNKYYITVNYGGDTYESGALKPFPSTPIQNVEFNQNTQDANVDILLTTAVPDNPSEVQYYRWTYKETWEMHPEYYSHWYYSPLDKSIHEKVNLYPSRGWKSASSRDIIASSSAYYGNNQIQEYKLYDIDRSDDRLYVLYSTNVMQRSLTKAEYEYETERKKISSDMGGLFTPQPSALPTNIHCMTSSKRALGYVGCALNVQHYRLFIYPDKISVNHKYTCTTVNNSDEHYPGDQTMYDRGYLIADYYELPGAPIEIGWSKPTCVDITYKGCTKDKPSFWPN